MTDNMYVARFSAWALGIGNSDEWNEWALGEREMQPGFASPDISFTGAMFNRRLSQISKMTIRVVHDLLPIDNDAKAIFLSFRGELSKQYTVNRMVIEDDAVMPAAFSLSVFNTPIALASMAFGLKGGYTAVYLRYNSFTDGLALAQASLSFGDNEDLIFVYADENPPQEYSGFFLDKPFCPFAFGVILTRKYNSGFIPLSQIKEKNTPEDFLKNLLLCGKAYAAS